MSFQVMAESKTIDQMIKLNEAWKDAGRSMINRLAQSGRFNSEEAQRAKREIASVQEESVQEMKLQWKKFRLQNLSLNKIIYPLIQQS